MKFRPKIDVGDYETKKGHVLRFLKKGARVKITIMFRGREMAHPEQGLNVLERLAEDLKPMPRSSRSPSSRAATCSCSSLPSRALSTRSPRRAKAIRSSLSCKR